MTSTPWLLRALGALGACALLAGAGPARAAAPQVKTQAPGYYRLMVGDFEVTVLFDGALPLRPDQLLKDTTPAQVARLLARSFEKEAVTTSVNAFLVNTGSKLVLVDAGAGALFGEGLGNLAANLKAAGYAPEQVDEVLITHMHGDHVGGLVADGKMVFPGAVVRADRRDAEYWLSPANLEKAPEDKKRFFQGAHVALDPYAAAGKLQPFDGDGEIVPGIRARAAHGHTPGHTLYDVESKGQRLVLWGDLVHVAAVQFRQPQATIQFDSDTRAAAAARRKEFARAARAGDLVGAAHLSFPGLGHLRAEGKGYAWVPVDYTPVR